MFAAGTFMVDYFIHLDFPHKINVQIIIIITFLNLTNKILL